MLVISLFFFYFGEQRDILTLNATVKNSWLVMTRRFVSAKRLVRYFCELVEHRALSPVRQVKMLAGWPFTDSH